MSIKSYLYARRPELAVASEFYGSYRNLRKAGFKKTPYGFLMAGIPSMQDGSYEADEVGHFIEHLRKADVLIDVGANVGYFSLIARSLNKKVVAVEPLWNNLQFIYHNLSVNDWLDVEVFPVGLADRPGVSVLYGVGTAASFIKDWAGISTKKRMVPVTTLDILTSGRFIGQELLIKIDVEGLEYSVLKGAASTLARKPAPVWIVESGLTGHFPGGVNENFSQLFELFRSHGYTARGLEADTGEPITEAQVKSWVENLNADGQYNFLFKKPD